jgi:hypothetical protein
MLIVSADESLTLNIIKQILQKFPGKHCGIVKHFNGMKVTWLPKSKSVVLTQPGHIQKLIDEFNEFLQYVEPTSLPIKPGLKFCKTGTSDDLNSEPLDTEKYHFRGLLGGILYVGNATRPDITFTTHQMAKYANAPTWAHWQALLRLLSYLRSTMHWGISLGGITAFDKVYIKHRPSAVAYADANHGTGLDDKRSVTGLVIHVYGGPVTWASKTQQVTSTSTTESEFRALSEVSREALWLAKIIKLFNIKARPFLIRGDNMGAIYAITNHCYTKHTKHIEIHHDFMRDRVMAGQLDFEHIKGVDNPADILTKSLDKAKFDKCRSALGMTCLQPTTVKCISEQGSPPRFAIV